MAAQFREDLRPAIAASMGLHIAVVVAGLISWPHLSRPAKLGSSAVPVTVVNYAPKTDVRPAEQADKVETATAPEPAPAAVEPPAPPAPKPEAVKPPPSPTPPPPPAAAKPVPSPTPKPAPKLDLDALAATRPSPRIANAKQALDLDALAASTNAQARRPTGARSNAAPGPPRPETDFIARLAVGAAQGLSADEAGLLAAKLNRLWNPNCGVEGGANVIVRVEMKLSPQGTVTSARVLEQTGGQGAIVAAAAQRAISAVRRGEPYIELPAARYPIWKEIVFNFNAKEACQNR